MIDFFLAALVLGLAAAGIIVFQLRLAREDKKAAGLRSANKGPRNG